MGAFWSGVTVLGYLVTLVLIRWVLLSKRRSPSSAIAWMFAIVLLPYLGGLLFVLFGINRVERKAARRLRASRDIGSSLPPLSEYQDTQDADDNQVAEADDVVQILQQTALMRLASCVAETRPLDGNSVELLVDTNRTFGLIEQSIGDARQSIHLEYYIWQPDRSGTRLRNLLIEKAREGVAIRFLYDGLGSSRLSRRFLKPMREAGISIARFLPGSRWWESWSLNLRSHRKIVLVDGRVGFTGGMNIGDEYLGRNPQLGYWRDTHLKIEGPCVLQLQQVFVEDWYCATQEKLTDAKIFPQIPQSGSHCGQVVASGPIGELRVMHTLVFGAINEARESVTLATSYFVPTPALVTALRTAAYRGVRVQLLVAGKSAYHWTVMAGRSFYDELLSSGVEIYEYERGLLHSKTITIDGNWSLVGTPNFDTRSLVLNFEVAVALYDEDLARQLEEQFAEDQKHARQVFPETWSKRPTRQVLLDNICRLFAPVL
jgi:cardiolipin synthase